ncbi:MAG: haloacid dehalogenase-like hydrolase [Eubacterium sp.]|nr:haloacid dehalogenase-like hydrolase [Eubacterium sp.]
MDIDKKLDIDLYDFDQTIFPYDSGTLFFIYSMIRYPWCIVLLPVIGVAFLAMLIGIIHFTQFKKICYIYVPFIPKKRAVIKFWDKYENRIQPWFKERKRYSVVISASPDFLLEEISKRLNFDTLISTRHNPKTGIIDGKNCRGEEKIRRLYEVFDKDEINVVDVYSDSLKYDKYIFSLANGKCFHIVKGEKIEFKYSEVYND